MPMKPILMNSCERQQSITESEAIFWISSEGIYLTHCDYTCNIPTYPYV